MWVKVMGRIYLPREIKTHTYIYIFSAKGGKTIGKNNGQKPFVPWVERIKGRSPLPQWKCHLLWVEMRELRKQLNMINVKCQKQGINKNKIY